MTASTTRPKRRRLTVIVGVVVLLLVAALVAAEFYVRNDVKDCLSSQFSQEIGSQVDIGLSAKPVLWQALDKQVPYVEIESADSTFGEAQDMTVRARANDIDISDEDAVTIGSSTADVTWTTTGILATVQAQTFGGLVTKVTSSAADGTLTFAIGPEGLAQLVVRPVIDAGLVRVETVNAQVLGFGIPTDLVNGIVEVVANGLQNYPLGMSPQTVTVTDTGIEMSLAGGAYQLPPSSQAQAAGASAPESCSMI
ncbi:MAG TPA: DUF2993 domain-containing protein [Aldersonia sp.]